MELKGSKTEANLMAAFAGETQARTKYHYYAEKAREDGYEHIAKIFEETAANEKAHAKIWFKLIKGGMPTTLDNLKDGASGEDYEWSEMYKEFEKVAKEEGFDNIARLFKEVGEIEKTHLDRYNQLIKDVETGEVFQKQTEVSWRCSNCGYIHYGQSAPDVCPVCAHPKAYFEVKADNY
ncbi:MAG: rubrerythrin family protein [Clostridia bacterium]|nr:rubrerythrin family protein [Clostridia bacterium]